MTVRISGVFHRTILGIISSSKSVPAIQQKPNTVTFHSYMCINVYGFNKRNTVCRCVYLCAVLFKIKVSSVILGVMLAIALCTLSFKGM